MLGVALYGSWQLWAPLILPPPIEYRGMPWPVLNDGRQVKRGTPVKIQADRCARRAPWSSLTPDPSQPPMNGPVTRYAINLDTGFVRQWSGNNVDVPVGCTSVPFDLIYADDLPVGHWRIYGSGSMLGYYTVTLTWQTEDFWVVE